MTIAQKLPVNQFDHFYKGGNRIGALRHGPGGPMRPEEWIGSVTTRFGATDQGLSRLSNGQLLRDAILASPTDWLGSAHYEAFGSSTELLCKLLDPDQDLPVHYHPNKSFSRSHLGLSHGKTEAWIILEAPEGATVGLGFKRTMALDEVSELVKRRNAPALINSLNNYAVSAGDTVLVPAGVVHSIGKDIFVLELQEPTDLSILLEWEKFAVDGEKDGHLGLGFDLALQALNLEALSDEFLSKLVVRGALSNESQNSVFSEVADPFFRADYLPSSGSASDAGFAVVIVLDGAGTIKFSNQPNIDVVKGDAIVIPHCAGGWDGYGFVGLLCRPPLPTKAEAQ